MAPPFALPEDVVEFVNKVLGRCNTRIASRLSRLPTIHETCRVLRATDLRATATDWPRNYAPSYGDLREALGSTYGDGRNRVGWRLEAFVSDEVLDCRQGYVARPVPDLDAGLVRVFSQRGAPISAALRIDINAPEGVELDEEEL